MNFRGPLLNADGAPLRCWATTFPDGARIEVELRCGRNGVVSASPVNDMEAGIEVELPPNEQLHPPVPDVRLAPFDLSDFRAPGDPMDEPLSEEEEAELDELVDPAAPRPDGSALGAGHVAP